MPRRNGLDPEDYPHKVKARIGDHPPRRVHELSPWNKTDTRSRLDQAMTPERMSRSAGNLTLTPIPFNKRLLQADGKSGSE
jgi:hypothetical protein